MPAETVMGYPYPENPDLVDVAGDIQDLAQAIDDSPGVTSLTQTQIGALTSAQAREGRVVHNLSTGRLQRRTATAWVDVADVSTAQTLSNKSLSGVANTFTAIPPEAVTGTAVVETDFTDHTSDTTNVHGIADTSALATKAYADQGEADARQYTDTEVSAAVTQLEAYADQAESDAKTAAAADATSKANAALASANSYTDAEVSGAVTQLEAYADQVAAAAAAGVVDAAPAALDTLNELAAALGDDANFSTTVTNALGGKASTAALTAHTSATTSVHGIPDTAALVATSDPRLSDARTPVAHKGSHASGGSDELSAADIGAAETVHTHDYSASTHVHPYAPDVHTHDYSDPAHTHPYADDVHTHPYSPDTHVHDYADTVHSHDYAGTAHAHTGYVESTLVDAAGDLLVGSGPDALGRLPRGGDGQVLSVDAAGSGVNALKWIDPPAGSGSGGGASLGSGLPEPLGVASAGAASTASRSDHVHARQFGGIDIAVGGSAPTAAAGYLWVDTSVEV